MKQSDGTMEEQMDTGGRRPATFLCQTDKMSGLHMFLKDRRGDNIRSVLFWFYHCLVWANNGANVGMVLLSKDRTRMAKACLALRKGGRCLHKMYTTYPVSVTHHLHHLCPFPLWVFRQCFPCACPAFNKTLMLLTRFPQQGFPYSKWLLSTYSQQWGSGVWGSGWMLAVEGVQCYI